MATLSCFERTSARRVDLARTTCLRCVRYGNTTSLPPSSAFLMTMYVSCLPVRRERSGWRGGPLVACVARYGGQMGPRRQVLVEVLDAKVRRSAIVIRG